MLGKFQLHWFFHGLMISEKNKNNDLLAVVVKYVVVQVLRKDSFFDRNLLCFVSFYLPRSCLVLVAYNKRNILCLFCLISKLFTLGNITFNSAYLGWIIFDIKQNGMEYLLIIITRLIEIDIPPLHLVLPRQFENFQKCTRAIYPESPS